MEEKKTKKIVRKDAESKEASAPAKSGSTVGLRIGSVVLWAVALACEVLCILLLNGTFYVPISMMTALIIGIVIDLVCVVVAAMLWKKANRIKPMKKEGNKVGFYLWSQLGLIMAITCFLPLIVILLKNKELDKKTKRIVAVVAIVAMMLAGALSIDYDPISAEEKASAENLIEGDVYWTAFGKKYHTHDDCQALANSDTLYAGSVTDAIEASRTTLCAFCARNDGIEGELKIEDAE